MCGIAGGIWTDPRLALESATLKRMVDVLAHRGPDDEGNYRSDFKVRSPYEPQPGIALGAKRLSVIDPTTGQQPVSNEDGTIWVVQNGEIYNYRDLRQRMEGAGHKFHSQCDTETLVHLYENEGTDFVNHLTGMFAIAIWDAAKRRLVLARDRLGQKPLVYRHQAGRLLFASEMKSLLEVPGAARSVDPTAIDEYLTYQYVPHPNSIIKDIHKLPPAHIAVYCDDQLTVERYWQPAWNQETVRDDYGRELRDRLTTAVQLRLQSDVPLGAFLSGGVDSSIIVALMQKLSSHPVKTFSIGFNVPEYDETAYADRVAKHIGTDHHVLEVDPSALQIVDQLAWHFDEPFGDSSAIPTWYVSKQTREHVTVALTGDGGDELFSGYPRYRAVRLGATIDRLPRPLRALAAARFWQSLPGSRRKSWLRRFKRFSSPLRLDAPRRYLEWISIFDERSRAALYTDDFLAELPEADPFYFLANNWQRADRRDAVTAAALTDLQTYLPCDLMTKVDIASMAHSLECRQPFLDHHVVELAVSMPAPLKYRRGRGKRILRQAFGDLLPSEIFRRAKMGFGVPLDHWFRHDLKDFAHEVLLDSVCLDRGIFQPVAIQGLLDEHSAGRRDHSDRLWALLMLELWHRQWVDK